MQEEWWESPTRFVNDYWWIFLIILFLALTGWFTRDYWLPAQPEPVATRVETLGTGDVQVTLIWDSVNDLDLWVTDPAGEIIYYGQKHSASNGELDVDANAGCSQMTASPVENIYWPTGSAPEGTYKISVQYFKICQSEVQTPFTVRLLVNGQTQTFDNIASTEKEFTEITTFTMQK